MRSLSDRPPSSTSCSRRSGAAVGAAPVAGVQARLDHGDGGYLRGDRARPLALQETIEESPSTLEAATESFRVQTPFLAACRSLAPPSAGGFRARCRRSTGASCRLPACRRTRVGGPARGGLPLARRSGRQPEHAARHCAACAGRPRSPPGAPVHRAIPRRSTQLPQLLPHAAREPSSRRSCPVAQARASWPSSWGRPTGGPPAELPRDHRVGRGRWTCRRSEDPQDPARAIRQALHPPDRPRPPSGSRGQADCQDSRGRQTAYLDRLADGQPLSAPFTDPLLGGSSHVVVGPDTRAWRGAPTRRARLGIDSV